MSALAIVGLIAMIAVGCFIPRAVASVLASIMLGGGGWWFLFIPLAIIGVIIDLVLWNDD